MFAHTSIFNCEVSTLSVNESSLSLSLTYYRLPFPLLSKANRRRLRYRYRPEAEWLFFFSSFLVDAGCHDVDLFPKDYTTVT